MNFDSLLQSNVTLGGANEPDLPWEAGVWKEIFGDGETAVEGHSFEGPILPTSLSLTFGSEGADDSALKRRRMGLEADPRLMAIKDKPDETWQDSRAAKLEKALRWERLDYLPVTSLNVGLQRQNDGLSEEQVARNVQQAVLQKLGRPSEDDVVMELSEEVYYLDGSREWTLSSQTTQHVDNRTLVETSLRQPLGALREVSYQLFKGDEILASTFDSSARPGSWRSCCGCLWKRCSPSTICDRGWQERGITPEKIRMFCVWRTPRCSSGPARGARRAAGRGHCPRMAMRSLCDWRSLRTASCASCPSMSRCCKALGHTGRRHQRGLPAPAPGAAGGAAAAGADPGLAGRRLQALRRPHRARHLRVRPRGAGDRRGLADRCLQKGGRT